jgi:hypothetical protein
VTTRAAIRIVGLLVDAGAAAQRGAARARARTPGARRAAGLRPAAIARLRSARGAHALSRARQPARPRPRAARAALRAAVTASLRRRPIAFALTANAACSGWTRVTARLAIARARLQVDARPAAHGGRRGRADRGAAERRGRNAGRTDGSRPAAHTASPAARARRQIRPQLGRASTSRPRSTTRWSSSASASALAEVAIASPQQSCSENARLPRRR